MALFRSLPGTAFLAILLLAGIWASLTLRFQTDLLPVLPQGLPSVRGLAEFSRMAAGEDEIFAVANPLLPEHERRRLLSAARRAAASVPGVGSVATPAEAALRDPGLIAAWWLVNAPPETFRTFAAQLAPDAVRASLADLPSRLAGAIDPAEVARLQLDPLGLLPDAEFPDIGTTEDAAFLIITPAGHLSGADADSQLVDAIRTAMAADTGGRVLLTGRPVFNADISRQMQRDILLMIGVAAVLLAGAFWIYYRTLRPLGWIMVLQFFALLAGLVAARIFFGELNVISIGFASILLGVGMDYSILVYHHFGSHHRDDDAVWRTLRRAIWFSAAVTAAAFGFLALTSFPALQQLGILVGSGLLSSALLATWQLPLILKDRPPEAPPVLFRASNAAASLVLRRRGTIIAAGCLLLLSLLWLRPWNAASGFYEPGLDRLRPVGSDAYTAREWLEVVDPSARDAVYVLRGTDHDTLRGASGRLAELVIPGEHASGNGLPLPSESAQATNLAAWPAGTASDITGAFDEAGLGEEWSEATLQMARALEAAANGDPRAFAGIADILSRSAGNDETGAYAVVRIPGASGHPVPSQGWEGLDQTVEIFPVSWISLTTEITALAQRDFTRLGLAVLAAIVILCAAAQRSLAMVGLNLLALALAALLYLWLLRVTGVALSPFSLISLPLLVGLVVDYSLHVLMALQNQHGDLRKTYDHLAAPITLTGLSACIGFGAPMLTGQPALQNFGLAMDLGIVAAVAACLVILPAFYPLAQAKDYRERRFYRALYHRRGFEWILLGWRLLGRRGAWFISRALGLFYALAHPETVRAVRDNIALLDPSRATFPGACRLFMNQAENFSTYGRLALRPTADVVDMLGFRQGFEHLQRARERGRGCLLVTGHLGFFELGGLVMAQLGFPMTALTLPEPSTALTRWRAEFRARWGVKTIVVGDHSFSVLDIVRSLREGAFVASLADRPYDGNAVPVDLPHGRIMFSTGPVLLALLAECPIVPVGITRQPDGKYHIEARAFIEPVWQDGDRQATLTRYTREIAAALVPLFAAYPDQWYHFSPLRCR